MNEQESKKLMSIGENVMRQLIEIRWMKIRLGMAKLGRCVILHRKNCDTQPMQIAG